MVSANPATTVRLDPATRAMLRQMATDLALTESAVLRLAVRRMYQSEQRRVYIYNPDTDTETDSGATVVVNDNWS